MKKTVRRREGKGLSQEGGMPQCLITGGEGIREKGKRKDLRRESELEVRRARKVNKKKIHCK